MDTQPGPRCSRSDEPADSAWASGRQIPERVVSRGGTEGTWVAYMPITPLDDLVMPSLAPGFGSFKFLFFNSVLRPQGSCLEGSPSLAAFPGCAARRTRSEDDPTFGRGSPEVSEPGGAFCPPSKCPTVFLSLALPP